MKAVILKSFDELVCLQTQLKHKPKPSLGGATQKMRKVVALPDAGRDDWTRFKRECVLLKGGK